VDGFVLKRLISWTTRSLIAGFFDGLPLPSLQQSCLLEAVLPDNSGRDAEALSLSFCGYFL
jgi:hypothetical protein